MRHDVVINAKIVVYDRVAHSDNVRPSDVRIVVGKLPRNLPGGLADRLNPVNQNETKVLVGVVRLAWDVLNFADRRTRHVEHLPDVNEVTRRHTAVRRSSRPDRESWGSGTSASPYPRVDLAEARRTREYIDVAFRSKVVAKHRAEQGESFDVVTAARCRDGVSVDRNVRAHGFFHDTPSEMADTSRPVCRASVVRHWMGGFHSLVLSRVSRLVGFGRLVGVGVSE